jgi:demethylspheroidene O-methyltransferase
VTTKDYAIHKSEEGRPVLDLLDKTASKLLRSPKFLRAAEKFPFTRPIARREARALFDICAGFVYAQILCACLRLKLFQELVEQPLDEAELARRIGLDERATGALLTASSALRLTKKCGKDRWALARLGAAALVSPGLTAMVEHHAILYHDLSDPVRLLRGVRKSQLAAYWPYALDDDSRCGEAKAALPYSRLMASTIPAIASEILDAVPLKRCECLLDAGGGDGTFLRIAAQRAPHLRLMLFELPAVAALARERFDEARFHSSVEIAAGSLKDATLPSGADIITLIRIILDHDDQSALKILGGVRRALPAGGAAVVAEPMAGTKGAESVGAYFSLYLLAMGRGRPRTKAELTALLHKAGFSRVREIGTRQPLLARILLAR